MSTGGSGSTDESELSDGPTDMPSVFRRLVGAAVSDDDVASISDHFSSMSPSDDGLDLYSKLPPVGDPARHEKLLDLLFADVAIRRHLGTDLSVHQYLRKYPELKREEVLGAFDAMGGQPEPAPSNIHASRPAPTANSALRPVGEYKLVEQLGAGGFGEVWLAEAPGGVPVAIKIIKRPIDDYTARQEHQALLLVKGLSHPCLVQTQAYWVLDDRLVIAMELCEKNLRQRLKECQAQGMSSVPKKELLSCFRAAAEALDHLHKNRVHHRDIKPENLLLHHGHLKIADFGLAFLYEGEASMMTAPEAGTGRYMAPEVWNRKLSKHSDQYSLALAYAELRLGRPIITGKGTVEFMKQHMEGEPDLTGLPMDEADVVRRALAKDPHDRYESCTAFVDELAATLREETKPKRRWLAPLFIAAGAVVAGAYFYSNRTEPRRTVVVDAPLPWIPEHNTLPVGTEQFKDQKERPWYKTLEVAKGGAKVKFVFVEPANSDLPPFYISASKITNGVMKAAYADDEFKNRVANWRTRVGPKLASLCFRNDWGKGGVAKGKAEFGDRDDLPALRLSAAEAAVVAEWLGGRLPTPQQWDAAAGLDRGEFTPFELPFEKVARKREDGPAPAGSFADVSRHGVFDVAGNGTEWTRLFAGFKATSIHAANDVAALASKGNADAQVLLRGFAYADTRPAEEILQVVKQREGFGILEWTTADPLTGFRVVLEPP